MKTVKLSIPEMHCTSCSITIEKALRKFKGVESSVVKMADHQAELKVTDDFDSVAAVQLVNRIGYDAEIVD